MYKKPNLKILNLKKRRKKNIDLFLDIAPESKNSMGKNQVEIQKMIIEQMKKKYFQKITSKIAVEITAYSSEKTPPRIERFIKNLLDLMHKKEILKDATDADFLPFEEDRDIKYLSVRYVFLPGKPHTIIRIRPFSSFISNLHFIADEINGDEADEKDDFISIKNHHEDLVVNKENYTKFFSEEAYESMLDLAILDVQKSLTSNMAITPFITRLIYPKKGTKPEFIQDVYKKWAESLIDFPIRIRFPELPTQKDTSKLYKAELRKQLSLYLEKNYIFQNLKAPVIATVFYSPPLGKKGFFKDVDNIMLEYVLPTFNEIFTPPLSLLNIHMINSDKFSHIPKSLNGSAIGYVIIELPKKYSENRKGFLSVGFEVFDLDKEDLIQSVDEKIESYMELNEYVD